MVWIDGELCGLGRPTMCKHQAGALLQFFWRSFVVPRLSLAPGPGDSFSEPVQSGTWCHVPSPHNYYRNACRHLKHVSFPRASPVPTGQMKCRDAGVVMSGLSPLLQSKRRLGVQYCDKSPKHARPLRVWSEFSRELPVDS